MVKIARRGLLVSALALSMLGVTSVATSNPALAATCATAASVSTGRGDFRFETQPLNSPYFQYQAVFRIVDPDPLKANFKLGGNGLKPGSRPTWDVYSSSDQLIGTLSGHLTGSNCVAPEITYPLLGRHGDVYKIKANYDAGNSGAQIRSQNFFVVTFQKAL
jgi:hypothetical protein